MTDVPEAIELLALLTTAERTVRRAVQEAGVDPEAAAAACAALAGEYTALRASPHDTGMSRQRRH